MLTEITSKNLSAKFLCVDW